MKPIDERIRVYHGLRTVDGDKLDPEEQAVRREVGVEIDVALGNGPADPNATPVGKKRAVVSQDMLAIDAARALGQRCDLCAYWRRHDWRELYRRWNDPSNAEGMRQLNRLRGELLDGGASLEGDDAANVENLLANAAGLCMSLTEAVGEEIVSFAGSGCSHFVGDVAVFVPRDAPAQRLSDGTYDAILRRAQGRVG